MLKHWMMRVAGVALCAASATAHAELPAAAAGAMGVNSIAPAHSPEETLLVDAIRSLEAGKPDDAVASLEALLARRPNFRLAQLVYADLLRARTGPLTGFGAGGSGTESLRGLRDEALRRLEHARNGTPESLVPESLVLPGRHQARLIVVDTLASRLYVFANESGELKRRYDYYATIGKNGALKVREGDQKTPVGVYFTTGRIMPTKLPDFFGAGALPLNYPNEWDMLLGRTGYGIWIHGVPSNTYNRAPQASDGCIAMSNSDLEVLWREISIGETPVIIANGVRWVDREAVHARRSELMAALRSWQDDWESLDFERYARNYDKNFVSDGVNRSAWLERKSKINAGKSFIDVSLSNISAFGYPGEENMLVVTFDQDYRSSNFSDQSKKRQYWRRGADGRWRIVFETEARFYDVHYRGMPYSVRANLTRLNPRP